MIFALLGMIFAMPPLLFPALWEIEDQYILSRAGSCSSYWSYFKCQVYQNSCEFGEVSPMISFDWEVFECGCYCLIA